jgi:nucleoside-diphosphate-sugar epimerase
VQWYVLGAGYVGQVLIRALVARGDEVTLTRRDSATAAQQAAEAGVRGQAADLANPLSLVIPTGAIVVCLAPPGYRPADEIRGLIAAAGSSRIVYVSSTGVYAPGGGAWVDESWPIAPVTASGRARVEAEAALAAAPSWIVLRAAGIYGPGRSTADRILAGSYRVIGDGTSHVSRIHVDDVVAAIVAAGTGTASGFVNLADDDPAPIGEVADAIAAQLGAPPPLRVSPDLVSAEIAGMLTANRRVVNTRMKQELGVVLRYPSWRDFR